MAQFDWQTDEDEWSDSETSESVVAEQINSTRDIKRTISIVLGGFIVILLGVGLLFTQIQKRAEAATDQITDTLLATHTLLQQAALSEDDELFTLTLLPSNEWRELQQELLARNLFWNRSALGLWLDLETFDPEDVSQIEVVFAPDLQQAEVTAVLPYVTMQEDNTLTPVALQKTAVYKQVNGSWQYIPYPANYWGEVKTFRGRNLTVKAPQQDAEISERLMRDIDQLIATACSLPELTCPSRLQVELEFLIDQQSNFNLNQSYEIRTVYRASKGRELQVDLPTPTLVGLPVDEAGYEALYRGYAAQVMARIVHYLVNERQTEPIDLSLIGLVPPQPMQFHPQSHLREVPIPLPEQDIVALCSANNVRSLLMRYDLQTANWSEEYRLEDGNGFINQMFSDKGWGVFISTLSPSDNGSSGQLVWIVNGESKLLDVHERGLNIVNVFEYWEEDTDDLAIFYFKTGGEELEELLVRLDPASCNTPAGCAFESLPYLPIFSPERTRSVVRKIADLTTDGTFAFWLGDKNGEPVASIPGQLAGPVWLDENSVLFVQVSATDPIQTSLVRLDVMDGIADAENLEPLLTSERIDGFLVEEDGLAHYIVAGVVAPSGIVDDLLTLLIVQSTGADAFQKAYLLQYDLDNGRLDWLMPDLAEMPLMFNLSYSPDGRFLQMVEMKEDVQTLHLFDLEDGELQSYPISSITHESYVQWSDDGQWMLLADKESLHLIAPRVEYERQIFYNEGSCNTAVWVNKSDGS